MSEKDDTLSDEEIARRMERGIRRFLNTPPQPHGKNPRSLRESKPSQPQKGQRKPKAGEAS